MRVGNDGALTEAARDLDTAEGGLGALPGDPKHQLEVPLLRGQMVANARQQRLDEAYTYLARAAVLAPDQAARFQQELAASSASAATISPTTTSTSSGTGPTSDSAATTTLPAASTSIG